MHSVAEFKEEIRRIFNTITPAMLGRASRHTWRRMQLFVDNDGDDTERLDG
jgi:hypothetical protein